MLELLAQQPDGLNVTEITDKLGKSYGELFRMLMVLEQRGYVESSADSDKYRLSLKMFSLANRNPPTKRLISSAVPVLKQLSYQLEQSCHLVTFFDGKGHVVVQQDAPCARSFGVKLGAIAPLLDSCSGHILLAFASKEQLEVMMHLMPEDQAKAAKSQLPKIKTQVRASGFEIKQSSQVHGVQDIGFPVFDNNGDIIAALVVPFLEYLDGSHPIDIEQAQTLIRLAADTISQQLGCVLEKTLVQ